MDRKEAADLLDNLIGMVEDSHGADYDTALKMGIEALSAQPDHSGDVNGKVDLIDRRAAIDVLEERLQANGYSNVALVSELNRIIGYLMQLPSAQPERKTGKWIHDGEAFEGGIDWMHCSECGHKDVWCNAGRTPYCPHCGARMVQEGEDNDRT